MSSEGFLQIQPAKTQCLSPFTCFVALYPSPTKLNKKNVIASSVACKYLGNAYKTVFLCFTDVNWSIKKKRTAHSLLCIIVFI